MQRTRLVRKATATQKTARVLKAAVASALDLIAKRLTRRKGSEGITLRQQRQQQKQQQCEVSLLH
jgi:hypothetical protein